MAFFFASACSPTVKAGSMSSMKREIPNISLKLTCTRTRTVMPACSGWPDSCSKKAFSCGNCHFQIIARMSATGFPRSLWVRVR